MGRRRCFGRRVAPLVRGTLLFPCGSVAYGSPCRASPAAPRAKRRRRCGRLSSREAVAQIPTELSNAVLRVGSKIARLVARTRRDRADVGDLSVRYGHHSAHSAGFRGRLCATASRERRSQSRARREARPGRPTRRQLNRAVAYRRDEQSGRPRLRSRRLSTAGALYGLVWPSVGEEL
jgi:hypothetical protein